MSNVVGGLNWHVIDPEGEHIAATRYAVHAAELALAQGAGTVVRYGRRVVLDVDETMKADRHGLLARRLSETMADAVFGDRQSHA